MAKNGNASTIMKELLSNFFKYANPILNTVLGFKADVRGCRKPRHTNDTIVSLTYLTIGIYRFR